jgi:hypothetical protein
MRIVSLSQAIVQPTSPAKGTPVKTPNQPQRTEDGFEPGLGNGGVPVGGSGGRTYHPKPRPPVSLPEPSPVDNTFPYQIWTDNNTGLPLPIFDSGTTDLGREVYQGGLGDCYLAASVSELAERRPDLIKSMIHDNGDGTVTVRLYRWENGQLKPDYIREDEKLPVWRGYNGQYLLTPDGSTSLPATQPKSIWWPLIEKAYATMLGGYQNLPAYPNDNAANALEALTGKPATPFGFSSDPNQVARDLQGMLASGKMVVVGTPNEGGLEQHGIVPFHVYSVYGAGVDKNGPYVLLRNPWGYFVPGDQNLDAKTNGYFRISASELLNYFDGGDFVDVPPLPAPAKSAPAIPPGDQNWHNRVS